MCKMYVTTISIAAKNGEQSQLNALRALKRCHCMSFCFFLNSFHTLLLYS